MPNQTPLKLETQRTLASRVVAGIPLDLLEEDGRYWLGHTKELHQKLSQLLRREGASTASAMTPTSLVWRGRTANLTVEVDYSRSVEDLVAQTKQAGWSVNSSITTERQMDFSGMPAKPAGTRTRKLSIVSPIKQGEIWSTSQVLTNLKAPGLAFGLYELCEFI
jgi:predicted GIY-YIG superfamily endonuclease